MPGNELELNYEEKKASKYYKEAFNVQIPSVMTGKKVL